MTGLLPLYDAGEMRALDSAAIERLGIPGAVLMERAGLAAAHEIVQRYPDASRAAVVCGSGNNGGDGFVVARHLHAAGVDARVLLVGQATKLGIDARTNLDICRRLDVPIIRRPPAAVLRRELRAADLIVDALFGTGFSGAPRAGAAEAIEAVNAAGAPVAALDVPSGVDASDGTVAGAAVDASLTVTFHGPKVGLLVSPGAAHAGGVVVADIGIPPQLERPTAMALATRELLELVPRKGRSSTKYSAGSVLVVGGAPGMSGAPAMTALAAMRAGAGLAWVAVPPDVRSEVAAVSPELMVRPLPDGLELADRADAVAVGPGLGRDEVAMGIARRLLQRHRGAIVADADALFALAGDLELLARRRVPAVLTPHEGEMARLIERDAGWVRSNRLAAVREAAARSRAVVLLKGADTLVAAPGGDRVVVSVADVPGLATAGSGDVLTGVIASMLARGLDPWTAACCGAVAHARAGRAAAERIGPDGIISGDVIDSLPGVFREA
ncbi:MAG: ADP-dependent NAD(P)H-hydrate dehydratase / NAD(P)H-hydrate epimerase [Gaiellales bacterium]|nr:ADP-dependent NAD(P)H-hydrate dehydratase / NAD(P)H-hydrate epimerase [Gaiellales bacterium]